MVVGIWVNVCAFSPSSCASSAGVNSSPPFLLAVTMSYALGATFGLSLSVIFFVKSSEAQRRWGALFRLVGRKTWRLFARIAAAAGFDARSTRMGEDDEFPSAALVGRDDFDTDDATEQSIMQEVLQQRGDGTYASRLSTTSSASSFSISSDMRLSRLSELELEGTSRKKEGLGLGLGLAGNQQNQYNPNPNMPPNMRNIGDIGAIIEDDLEGGGEFGLRNSDLSEK